MSLSTTETVVAKRRRLATTDSLMFFILQRILTGFFLIIGITLIAFTITQLVPGDPAAANLGQSQYSDPAIVAAFYEKYGLDQPVHIQYWKYLTNLVQLDFGMSIGSGRPVSTDLAEYLPATVEIAFVAIVFSLIIGLALGTISAITRDRLPDQVIRVFSLTGVSMPMFWTALTVFYIFFFVLGWSPGSGRLEPGIDPPSKVTGLYTVDSLLAGDFELFRMALSHLALPALVLGIYTVGLLTRFTRASVLEILGNDYVRAARAKGLSEWTVIRRHVLRPALLSIVTVAGVAFASLLSGSVLVENVFSWPGLGQYAFTSALGLDLPGVMGVSMVVAFVYISMNIIVDVLYRVIDPTMKTNG